MAEPAPFDVQELTGDGLLSKAAVEKLNEYARAINWLLEQARNPEGGDQPGGDSGSEAGATVRFQIVENGVVQEYDIPATYVGPAA